MCLLFLLFTVVPLVELGLLIWIGTRTSVWFTLGLVILTGLVGAALARWQGWRTATRIRKDLQLGRMPADAMLDAALIFVAGVVLITPGVLTDAAGFALLVPPLRRVVKRRLVAWLTRNFEVHSARFASSVKNFTDGPPDQAHAESRIIDVQVEERE